MIRQLLLCAVLIGGSHLIGFTHAQNEISSEAIESTPRPKKEACSRAPSSDSVPSGEQLSLLREQMVEHNISAYLMPMDSDQRIQWLSGFSGTQGKVVVTLNEAALWTDGRYFLQAMHQLDCNWRLVREGEPDEPSISSWISSNLKDDEIVGSDPNLLGAKAWNDYVKELDVIMLKSIPENLVDLIRTDNYTKASLKIVDHPLEFAGKDRDSKIIEIRQELDDAGYEGMVVTEEDEIAWLLNLRGEKDISVEDMVNYKPTFESIIYLPVQKNKTIFLWCKLEDFEDKAILTNESSFNIEIEDISKAHVSLQEIILNSSIKDKKILVPSKSVYESGASYAIYEVLVPKGKLDISPIILKKAIKNDVEIEGMKRSHIRDSVALIEFMSFIEDCVQVKQERNWTEINAAQNLFEIRRKKENNRGLSFTTISAFGSNGAIIHYRPLESTNKVIDNSSLYLLDSGGQYLDGTTDVTRTFHFGEPTNEEINMYTRVLAGAIDIARVKAPVGVIDRNIDYAARQHFYDIGKNYRHGTGHGIGSYLYVHENPTRLAMEKEGTGIKPGMFFSDEPGYYEDERFGIRLETILQAVEDPEISDNSYGPFLQFEPVTLVPFEPKLINKTYLTRPQRQWLTEYNELLNKTIAPLLVHDELASEYLLARTSENYLE